MFALRRKPKTVPATDFYPIARQYPGKLVILPNCIVAYLADVDVMMTTYVDTRKLSGEECLERVLSQTAKPRHHQIYL